MHIMSSPLYQRVNSKFDSSQAVSMKSSPVSSSKTRFGTTDVRQLKHELVNAYYDTAIKLAQANVVPQAKEMLKKATDAYFEKRCYSNPQLIFGILNVYAKGIPPYLTADHEQADQLMTKILEKNQDLYKEFRSDKKLDIAIAELYQTQLAPRNPQYNLKAVSIYKNVLNASKTGLARKLQSLAGLLKLNEIAVAKDAMNQLFQDWAQSSSKNVQMDIVKIWGGITLPNQNSFSEEGFNPNHLDFSKLANGEQATHLLTTLATSPKTDNKLKLEAIELLAVGSGKIGVNKDLAKTIVDSMIKSLYSKN